MKYIELGKYVVSDPKICHGKLTFKGTRVLVEVVLSALVEGRSKEEILKGWPSISWEAVQEAQMIAVHRLVDEFPGGPQPWHDEVARLAERDLKELELVEAF